jgi:hypothetical protein
MPKRKIIIFIFVCLTVFALLIKFISISNDIYPESKSRTILVGEDKKFKTIQKAVDSIRKNINYGVDITIEIEAGIYDEYVGITGFNGAGRILIKCGDGAGREITSGVTIDGCTTKIEISAFSTSGFVYVGNSKNVRLSNVKINSSSGKGFIIDNSTVDISNCTTNNCLTAYDFYNMSRGLIEGMTGMANADILKSTLGSIVSRSDTMNPGYSGNLYTTGTGGIIIEPNGVICPAQ